MNTPFLVGKMGRTTVELRLKVGVLAVIQIYAKGQENPRHKVVSTQGKTDQSPRREGGVLSVVLKEMSSWCQNSRWAWGWGSGFHLLAMWQVERFAGLIR